VLGPILGPPLGGLIVTHASWRWIFFINVPIGLIGIILATRHIPHVSEKDVSRLDLRGFLLAAAGLAGLVFGFDNIGHDVMPAWAIAAMLAGGAVSCLLYVLHARRTADPIIDLSLLAIRTFRTAALGGLLSRLILGATPFLLALLLQVGLGLSALEAGMLTFVSALGAIIVKGGAPAIIRLLGFRTVLTANALLLAATSAGYALFDAGTPYWLMVIMLLLGGFCRSLQFTTLNAIAYADIPVARMSRASSLSSVFQQLAQSLGVGLAATIVEISRGPNNHVVTSAGDIAIAFPMIALLSLLALPLFLRLPADAAAEVAGRQ
jgi:MFS family permease